MSDTPTTDEPTVTFRFIEFNPRRAARGAGGKTRPVVHHQGQFHYVVKHPFSDTT